jgi:hypothetical protein
VSERTPVYRLYGANGELLYIGLSVRLSSRMREHSKSQAWWHSVTRIELEWQLTERAANAAERAAILAENPRHNIQRYPAGPRRLAPRHPWVGVPPELARAIKRAARKVEQARAARNGKVGAARGELGSLVYEALSRGCRPGAIGAPVKLSHGQIKVLRDRHIARNPGLPVPDPEYISKIRDGRAED